jgi:hypothetical protein
MNYECRSTNEAQMVGKRIQIEDEAWLALRDLANDRSASFQELMDEAIVDLLRKHGRPLDLREALKSSTNEEMSTPVAARPAPRKSSRKKSV